MQLERLPCNKPERPITAHLIIWSRSITLQLCYYTGGREGSNQHTAAQLCKRRSNFPLMQLLNGTFSDFNVLVWRRGKEEPFTLPLRYSSRSRTEAIETMRGEALYLVSKWSLMQDRAWMTFATLPLARAKARRVSSTSGLTQQLHTGEQILCHESNLSCQRTLSFFIQALMPCSHAQQHVPAVLLFKLTAELYSHTAGSKATADLSWT